MPLASPAVHLRRVARLLTGGAWTVLCYLAWAPGWLVTRPFPRLSRRWQSLGIAGWSRGVLRILGIRVRALGAPPPPPVFFVANHLSWLDILVLGARFGPTFVAKQEISGWPIFGHLAWATGAIFVDRGRRRDIVRVLGEIDRAAHQGATIVLFPEGTSSRGDQVYPLRPGLLEWAAGHGQPVYTIGLSYGITAPGWSAEETVCWWGDRSFGDHLRGVLGVPAIHAVLVFGDEPVVCADRQALAVRLRHLLTRQLHVAKTSLPPGST